MDKMGLTADNMVIIIGIILIVLVLFFLVREILCWYWKINERLNRLDQIEKWTKKTYEVNVQIHDLLKDVHGQSEKPEIKE